jgi:hypothetical protein
LPFTFSNKSSETNKFLAFPFLVLEFDIFELLVGPFIFDYRFLKGSINSLHSIMTSLKSESKMSSFLGYESSGISFIEIPISSKLAYDSFKYSIPCECFASF